MVWSWHGGGSRTGEVATARDYRRLGHLARRHWRSLLPFFTARKAANAALALLEMAAGSRRCASRPPFYRVDPCTRCDLRCPNCASRGPQPGGPSLMSYDDFVTVLDRVSAHALRVSLYDQGEPLLHPDVYRMVGAASDRGVSTLICTNFNSFREEHLRPLFQSRLTVLSPCLDGYSQAVYERYRRGGRVDRVKEAIRMCAARKRATGARFPFIDVQVILFPHLRSEIPAIDGFLRACHVDRITYRQEILGYSGADGTFSAARRVPVGVRRCHWLYLGMLVATDGSVYPCCAGDWGRKPYGNILREDLASIWNNRLYRFSRALFTEGPDLAYDPELAQVPCLRCELFPPLRRMRTVPEWAEAPPAGSSQDRSRTTPGPPRGDEPPAR